jgi:hypothetical protein
MYLTLSLVSKSVVSGLCLVLAKYWHDRREEKQALNAAYRNGTAEWASGYTEDPQASAAAMDVQAALSASSAAADTVAPDSQAPGTAAVAEPHRGTMRERIDDDHRVEEALASGDLSSMDTLLEDICDPVLRNRLLNQLVDSYYRLRADSKHRADFYRVADVHIEEAPSILEGIEEIGRPRPNHIDAFKSMVIVLDEDGRQDTAIAVCELALSLGLQDGTKTGFEGRITRLKKSRMRIGTVSPEKLMH